MTVTGDQRNRNPRRCDVADCDRAHFGRGLCQLHYWRKRRAENPLGDVPCNDCGGVPRAFGQSYCAPCNARRVAVYQERKKQDPEWREAQRVYRNGRNRIRRLEAIAHYGGKCACCGESEVGFLSFDHIDGGGAEHRRKDPTAYKIATWLIRNGFPEGFQLLCHNCNLGRHLNGGRCPHECQ